MHTRISLQDRPAEGGAAEVLAPSAGELRYGAVTTDPSSAATDDWATRTTRKSSVVITAGSVSVCWPHWWDQRLTLLSSFCLESAVKITTSLICKSAVSRHYCCDKQASVYIVKRASANEGFRAGLVRSDWSDLKAETSGVEVKMEEVKETVCVMGSASRFLSALLPPFHCSLVKQLKR